jgi:hypothetical protein
VSLKVGREVIAGRKGAASGLSSEEAMFAVFDLCDRVPVRDVRGLVLQTKRKGTKKLGQTVSDLFTSWDPVIFYQ